MSRPAGFQILIVDDEKVQREMLAGFLSKQGYKTVAVEDGAKALERYSSGSFDLVLTDFRMPGMDGFALLKELKRRNPEAVVVIMTAYGTVNTAVAAMKEGAYDYLTKPIDLDELLLRIQRVEREASLKGENRELKEELRREIPGRFHHHRQRKDGRSLEPRGPGGPQPGNGPDPGGERDREGAVCAGHPLRQPARRQASGEGQLRGAAGEPPGKRTLRTREGGLHRGRGPAGGPFRAGGWRIDLSG